MIIWNINHFPPCAFFIINLCLNEARYFAFDIILDYACIVHTFKAINALFIDYVKLSFQFDRLNSKGAHTLDDAIDDIIVMTVMSDNLSDLR